MFSMNDIGGTGSLSKGDFARMLRFDPHFLLILASVPITAAHFALLQVFH